jgi:hypothetical protein
MAISTFVPIPKCRAAESIPRSRQGIAGNHKGTFSKRSAQGIRRSQMEGDAKKIEEYLMSHYYVRLIPLIPTESVP